MNDFLESGRPAGLLLQDVQDSRIARDLLNRAVRRVVSVYETICASVIEDPSGFADVLKAVSLPPVSEFEKKLRLLCFVFETVAYVHILCKSVIKIQFFNSSYWPILNFLSALVEPRGLLARGHGAFALLLFPR